ncbi:MAG: GNAT family N-acetyltransferase [Candidatus Heimdallarchaeota archaeon]
MIQVESKKLSSEDCQIIASIVISARKGTPLELDKTIDELAVNIEDLSKNVDYQIFIARNEKMIIVGWIYYYVGIAPMAFINGFLPIVDQSSESEKIGLSLINASKRNVVERGYSRLEIQNDLPSDAHRKMSGDLLNWYKKCGFKFAAEEMHMKTNLGKIKLPEYNIPNGYTLRKFSEVSYEQLEDVGFQVLQNSGDELFISMSQAEQKVSIEYFFDKSRNFIEDGSLILEKQGKVVGFIITRVNGEEADIGPFGLIPEVRGQGLGKYLLGFALNNMIENGFVSVCLDVSTSNLSAKRLYNSYGFENMYYKRFYYWSP